MDALTPEQTARHLYIFSTTPVPDILRERINALITTRVNELENVEPNDLQRKQGEISGLRLALAVIAKTE